MVATSCSSQWLAEQKIKVLWDCQKRKSIDCVLFCCFAEFSLFHLLLSHTYNRIGNKNDKEHFYIKNIKNDEKNIKKFLVFGKWVECQGNNVV